jgi:uncharacterized membrane protein (DUF485 family)
MKNKWAYIGMNLCWIFSFLFYFTSTTVCNELGLTFQTGIVMGVTNTWAYILGILGFIFSFIIIGNNIKEKSKNEGMK